MNMYYSCYYEPQERSKETCQEPCIKKGYMCTLAYGTATRRKGKGFTLIELLVVVAIIAVLVAILVPSLQEAREIAIEVKCGAQLHSLLIAGHMYASDYRQVLFWRPLPETSAPYLVESVGMDFFVWVGREGRDAGQTENTFTASGSTDLFNTMVPRPLNAYINNAYEIAHDPGDTESYYVSYGPVLGGDNWYEMTGNSYSFNAIGHPYYATIHPDITGTDVLPGGLRGKNLDRIERASQTVFALDSGLYRPPDDGSSWHRKGMANMAFVDGHAEFRKLPMENPYGGGDNEGIYWDEHTY